MKYLTAVAAVAFSAFAGAALSQSAGMSVSGRIAAYSPPSIGDLPVRNKTSDESPIELDAKWMIETYCGENALEPGSCGEIEEAVLRVTEADGSSTLEIWVDRLPPVDLTP